MKGMEHLFESNRIKCSGVGHTNLPASEDEDDSEKVTLWGICGSGLDENGEMIPLSIRPLTIQIDDLD